MFINEIIFANLNIIDNLCLKCNFIGLIHELSHDVLSDMDLLTGYGQVFMYSLSNSK